MDTTNAFQHAETGFYYLVVKSSWAQSYTDRLESLCSSWFVAPASHIVDAAIVRNVPLGYLGESLATAFRARSSTVSLTAPARAGGPPPPGAAYETLCVYYAASPGFRGPYDEELKALDYSWRAGDDGPADGFASSVVKISIDMDGIDLCLVACACYSLWHPDKDKSPKDPRYEALLRIIKPELPPIKKLDIKRVDGFGPGYPIIETRKLTRKDLPTDDSLWFDPNNANDPRSPMGLALSFAGYEFLESLHHLLATVEEIAFDGQPRVLECFNTTGLRLLLFALQRRSHNADAGLETDALTRAIIAQLRVRLAA